MNRMPNRTQPIRRHAGIFVAAGIVVSGTVGCLITDAGLPAANACAVDSAVTGCPGSSLGYSCLGSGVPTENDPSLVCVTGSPGTDGAMGFCCSPGVVSTCSLNASVTGCAAGGAGYSCQGTDTPDVANPALTCSAGVAGTSGATNYCCSTAAASSCMSDAAVTMSCTGGATGYTCMGTDVPDQSTSSLVCSSGTPTNAATAYCCIELTSSTCAPSSSVTGCTGASYGISCTGTQTPAQANPSLTCSAATPGNNGEFLYCCTG